jgi:hypothetical protein
VAVLDPRTIPRLAELICDIGGPYERRTRELIQLVQAAGWDVAYEGGARVPWLVEVIERHNDDPDAIDALLRRVIDPREYAGGLDAAIPLVAPLNALLVADDLEVGHSGHRAVVYHLGGPDEGNTLEDVAARLAAPELRATVHRLVRNPAMAEILISRLDEVEAARRAGAHLLAIIGTGSFVEGLLHDVLRSRDKETKAQTSTTLDWLLKRAHTLGWIEHDAFTFSGYVRGYRNYVHPRQQLSEKFSPDADTVLLCWQPVLAVINDFDRLLPGPRTDRD